MKAAVFTAAVIGILLVVAGFLTYYAP